MADAFPLETSETPETSGSASGTPADRTIPLLESPGPVAGAPGIQGSVLALPRGRGRPKGAPNKRPRKPAAPRLVTAPPPAPPPPSPFAGGLPGDGAGQVTAAMPTAAAIAALPAEELAKVAVTVGEGVALALATARYGKEIADAVVPLAKQERETLEPLTTEWIKTSLPSLTAGEVLGLMLVISIGQRVTMMEMMLNEKKREQKEAHV